MEWALKGLSRKTTNTRKKLWNVYCCAPNQMGGEIVKQNGLVTARYETTNWIFLSRLTFNFIVIFQKKWFFFYFSLCTNEGET